MNEISRNPTSVDKAAEAKMLAGKKDPTTNFGEGDDRQKIGYIKFESADWT